MSRKSSIDMPKEASSPECYTTSTSSNEISENQACGETSKIHSNLLCPSMILRMDRYLQLN